MKKDNERHSFIRLDYDSRVTLTHTSYLFECGVFGTFISSGFYHNLYQMSGIGSTLLFMCPPSGVPAQFVLKMKYMRIVYESPAVEVVEIEVESCFAGSGDGTGTGSDWPGFDEESGDDLDSDEE